MKPTIAYRIYEHITTTYKTVKDLKEKLADPFNISLGEDPKLRDAAFKILNYCWYNRMTDRLIGEVLKQDGQANNELKNTLWNAVPSIGLRIISNDKGLIDHLIRTARQWGGNIHSPSQKQNRLVEERKALGIFAPQEAFHCDSYILIVDKEFEKIWPNNKGQWREIYDEYASAYFRGLSTYVLISDSVDSGEIDTIVNLQKARWPADTMRRYSDSAMLHRYFNEIVSVESNLYGRISLGTLASNRPEQKVIISYAGHGVFEETQLRNIEKNLAAFTFEMVVWDHAGSGMSRGQMVEGTENAIAAVLFVTEEYMQNENVRKHQLPVIAEAKKQRGLKVFRLVLSSCDYKQVAELEAAEGLNEQPLEWLKDQYQEEILADLAQKIYSKYLTGQGENYEHEAQRGKIECRREELERKRAREEFDVFISYNTKDKDAVEKIVTRLEQEAGLLSWFDKREMGAGQVDVRVLEQKIEKCKCAAVFVGASGFGNWHAEEIALLTTLRVKQTKKLVPVLLPGTSRPPKLPGFLANLHYVDCNEDGWFEKMDGELRDWRASPKVFISYSHDGEQHEEGVLALADRLRHDGIDAEIDQYETSPPEGWSLWCEQQIEAADFVLMICTENYYRRVRGKEEPGKGLGVVWEARIIRQILYDAGSVSAKFIPVLFSDGSVDHIPPTVKAASQYFVDTDDGYEGLCRQIRTQPWVIKPPLGKPKALPARQPKSEAATAARNV